MRNLVRLLVVAFSLEIALGCSGTIPAHERPGVIPRERTFHFQGWTWWTRADNGGPSGPGGNRWDDGPSAARVTTRGLELTMKRDAAGLWRSVEAMTPLPHRYGCLEVTLEGFVDRHPPEVVVAVFVYRDDTSEFDVEWTRFGRAERPNAQYTIASTHPLRQKTFRLRQRARNHTVKLDWKRRSLVFETTDGPRWTHRGPEVPKPDGHYLHVALWRVDDLAPRDGRQVKLVIRAVAFDEHCDERRPSGLGLWTGSADPNKTPSQGPRLEGASRLSAARVGRSCAFAASATPLSQNCTKVDEEGPSLGLTTHRPERV